MLIGSFFAAAFGTPFNATVFRLGVLTYAAYVVLFPGSSVSWRAGAILRSARAEFDVRIRQFNDPLAPPRVSQIVGKRVDNTQGRYDRWLLFVAGGYVAVATPQGSRRSSSLIW